MKQILFTLLLNMVLTLCSYNSQGLGDGRIEYIDKLCENHDIVLVQETWLLKDNLSSISDKVNNMCGHGVSAVDDATLLVGRPHGGCSILWKRSLILQATPVINIESKRLCAVIFRLPSGISLLVVNVYMPCDSIVANIAEYRKILDEISSIALSTGADLLIFGGDFNTDFNRNTQNTAALVPFIQTESLENGLSFQNSDVSYTFESKINGIKSTIDHFLVSANLLPVVTHYVSIHEGDNLSDHCPISMWLNIDLDHIPVVNQANNVNMLDWGRVSKNDIILYQEKLDEYLVNINIPPDLVGCHALTCTNHNDSIEYLFHEITQACLNASIEHVPMKANHPVRVIPGWNEIVREHKQKAIFWHNLWKSNGSPRNGVIADIRRRTRSQYHLSIKKARRNSEKFTADKLAEDLMTKDNTKFWKEIKKSGRSTARLPNNVNGHTGSDNICAHFAEKYRNLYNSVSYDVNEMEELLQNVDENIADVCESGHCKCYLHHHTNVDEVVSAVNLLKYNKNDGHSQLSTNHLKYGSRRLFVLISMLFSSMLEHGYIPNDMLRCTVMPIPKNNRKSLNDSSNYRGIALNSPLCKLFETIILRKCQETLETSDMQFGYKKGLSTVDCTFIVNEVVQYYLNGGGNVYAMLLDASQAFDKVHYTKMVNILLNKGICPVIARIIAYLHINQQMRIRWDGVHSAYFNVSNGVKQGGILSPFLFSIYVDQLLLKLKGSGFGCYIGTTFTGAFAYADDIIILCPSKFSLKAQLQLTVEFSDEFMITFNPAKCHLLFYQSENVRTEEDIFVIFQGLHVRAEGSTVHLGNVIGPETRDQNVVNSTSDFNRRVNVLLSRFHYCHTETKVRLFQTYCLSLYGCILWDLSNRSMDRFYTAWRKAVRRVVSVHPMTHCALLPLIIDTPSIDITIHRRLLNFINRVSDSDNEYNKLAYNLVLNGSASAVSNSVSVIVNSMGISREQLKYVKSIPIGDPSEELIRKAVAIREFLSFRDEYSREADDFNTILRYMCTQ